MEGIDLTSILHCKTDDQIVLKNPIMIASGTFGYDGYGRGITSDMPLGDLGAVIPKTVTRLQRDGNPEPRWYPKSFREARDAKESIFLNSIGLANPGIEHAMTVMAPEWEKWDATVVLSMSGESSSEFGEMARMTKGVAGFEAIELNLSCPNIEDGAMFSHSPSLARAATESVRSETHLPVLVKLAPNVPDITDIVRAVELGGADAVTLCNTIPAMAWDYESGRPILGGITGGLSGPALKAVALALVYRASASTDLPIIGVGGIFSAVDVVEFLMAGAVAVQIGSANLANLEAPFQIKEDLVELMCQRSWQSIDDVKAVAISQERMHV
tara:strand:+ start:406 stop:1389 length:984 start_codon:yes stop_codon:yes gene_type:complete